MNFKRTANAYLILIGGSEDKRGEKIILRETVKISRANKVAIIPTASSIPGRLSRDYINAFSKLGVGNVEVLDIRYRDEADKEKYLKIVEETDLIFFTGGDQERLVKILNGSKLLQQIKIRHQNGMTIAGTSAGAAAASNPMIFKGTQRGFSKGTVSHSEGFGFIENVTIDTHFVNRKRISRLTQFLSGGISNFGIGLAEDTAIIISPDNTFKVIGSGAVTILNSKKMRYTNFHEIKDNEQITSDGMNLSFLFSGTVFDLNKGIVKKDSH